MASVPESFDSGVGAFLYLGAIAQNYWNGNILNQTVYHGVDHEQESKYKREMKNVILRMLGNK